MGELTHAEVARTKLDELIPQLGLTGLARHTVTELRQEIQRRVYLVDFKNSRVTHGMVPQHGSLGDFLGDQMFGGGLRIFCGRECNGPALISAQPMPPEAVTCKRCLKGM